MLIHICLYMYTHVQAAPEEFKEEILMNRKMAWIEAKQNGEEMPEGCDEWDEERERERLRNPFREQVCVYMMILCVCVYVCICGV